MAKVTCKKCGKSFETEIEMKFCPFCGAKIEKEKPKHIEDMESLLITIRDDFGMEVFKNGKQTVAIMRDLSPKLTREIKLYQIVANNNLFVKYEEAFKLTNEKRELKLTEIEQELETDFFLAKPHIETLKKWHMCLFDVKEEKKLTEKELKTIEKNLDELFDYFKPNVKYEENDHSQDKSKPLEKANIGDIVTFGIYKKEPITWKVLDKKDDNILVISEYALNLIPYKRMYQDDNSNLWEHSDIREWLNHDFYNEAFTKKEQKNIIPSNSNDNVFVLSIDEVNKYFKSKNDRLAKGTQYAQAGLFAEDKTEYMNWWLRDSGENKYYQYSATVDELGNVDVHGRPSFSVSVGVRPAMWISLKPKTKKKSMKNTYKEGSIITFGNYMGEDITWKVLFNTGSIVMVVSEKILDAQPFDEHNKTNDWKKSSLRTWLNTKFYYHAFSTDEQNRIKEFMKDKIHLLSVPEANFYLKLLNNPDLCAQGTNYAISQNLYVANNGCSVWWLNTPGNAANYQYASNVSFDGRIDEFGQAVFKQTFGVRPVIWITIE